MTVFENGVKTKGQIMVVISGNRPFLFMKEQIMRYAGYDGRLNNLDSDIPASLMPVISDNWDNYFTWNGIGEMPRDEKLKLHEIATKAKYKGYLLRFWATPNQSKEQRTAVWTVLINAGVGMIGMENRGNILGDYRLHFPDQMGIVGDAEPIKKRNDSMQRSILFLRIIDLLSGNTFLNALNLPMP